MLTFLHSVSYVYAVLPFYDVKCLCSGGREFKSQGLYTIKIKYWNASGSGFPPSLIPALQNIGVLHHKKAKLPKHLQHSVSTLTENKISFCLRYKNRLIFASTYQKKRWLYIGKSLFWKKNHLQFWFWSTTFFLQFTKDRIMLIFPSKKKSLYWFLSNFFRECQSTLRHIEIKVLCKELSLHNSWKAF